MFWNLLLAHFLADYPLQTNWMVRNKSRPGIMAGHALIPLAVMLLAIFPAGLRAWAVLVVLTLVHYFLDVGKLSLGRIFPKAVVIPYLLDQLIHYITLLLAAVLITYLNPGAALLLPPGLAILATAFTVVTYVWFITERVISYAQPEYVRVLLAEANARMLARAGLLAVLELAAWGAAALFPTAGPPAGGLWALPVLALSLGALPSGWLAYRSPLYRKRAMLTDLAVVTGVFVFSILARLSI